MILRLLCAMEATSVFFRTTSTFDISLTLQRIETAITFGHSRLVVSSMLSLFLSFPDLPVMERDKRRIHGTWRQKRNQKGSQAVAGSDNDQHQEGKHHIYGIAEQKLI